jgi:hypothetical protein
VKLALLIAIVSTFLLSGCGQSSKPESHGAADASLRVTHVVDRTGGAYTEGSIWHVRVFDSSGQAVVDRRVTDEHASLDLAPGRYRFVSEELPCDGNCSVLDPGTDGCSKEFTANSGTELTAAVTLRPTHGCTILFGT